MDISDISVASWLNDDKMATANVLTLEEKPRSLRVWQYKVVPFETYSHLLLPAVKARGGTAVNFF